MSGSGVYVAFSGSDGVGKSTIARALLSDARQSGKSVVESSWKASMSEGPNSVTMSHMFRSTLALMFGAAEDPSRAAEIAELVQDEQVSALELDERLTTLGGVSQASHAGFLAAAAVELGGNIWLQHEVTEATRRGDLVINDSWGLKHCFKELWLGGLIADRVGSADERKAVAAMGELIESTFAATLHPEVGIHVHCPPELALERRRASNGPVGCFEDARLAGRYGSDGWDAMHLATSEYLFGFAEKSDWLIIDTSTLSVDEAVELARSVIPGWSA